MKPFLMGDTYRVCRPDVDAGSYILNVISHNLVFDPVRPHLLSVHIRFLLTFLKLRVDVPPSSQKGLPDVRPYVPGTPHNPPSIVTLPYPMVLSARQKAQFFVERQSFNALSMLQNPMMLMMGVTGVLVLAMPYIMVCDLIHALAQTTKHKWPVRKTLILRLRRK